MANLYDPSEVESLHHVEQALRAHTLYKRDMDYVVKEGEVLDRGRVHRPADARPPLVDGLHQAIEAKEGVRIENENQTLATISFQNYFRMYSKLSGMTGTADTEAEEFAKIYNLDVRVVPTNRDMVRKDVRGRRLQNRAREVRGGGRRRSRSCTRRASRCWWARCPSPRARW